MAKGNLRDRIESEVMATIGTHNQNMVCRDCLLRYDDSVKLGNATKCEAFPVMKPIKILFDGGDCSEYVKE